MFDGGGGCVGGCYGGGGCVGGGCGGASSQPALRA